MDIIAQLPAQQPTNSKFDLNFPSLQSENTVDFQKTSPLSGYLFIPSSLPGFVQTAAPIEIPKRVNFGTYERTAWNVVTECTIQGVLTSQDDAPKLCPHCSAEMEKHGVEPITLSHLPLGMSRTKVQVTRQRWFCPSCGRTSYDQPAFKADGHRITLPLHNFVCNLLELGLTLKAVSQITGLSKNVVKDIDKKRLEELYTEIDEKGDRVLKPPEKQARHLGIDEFKLHDGPVYATIIIDLDTGYVLWLAHSKKKQVVYDFMAYVGEEWMKGVEAVACDMNGDFTEPFRELYPHIDIVYDRFHLVKNFNENVISEIRKDEQRRLESEGESEAAKNLKRTKYVLMTTLSTRKRKDQDAKEGKVISRGSTLFPKPEVKQKGGNCERYENLIRENELLSACDIVKEMLSKAYEYDDEEKMRAAMREIIEICRETQNKHFEKYANLLERHMAGIVTHADYRISSGRVEGTNGMIKALRRTGYGYPDDDYFFLKIFNASRRYAPTRKKAA